MQFDLNLSLQVPLSLVLGVQSRILSVRALGKPKR